MMKSAYELAMERLKEQDTEAEKPVSDKTKAALAAIDEKFKAKIAEREIFLKAKLQEAMATGSLSEADAIRKQISSERTRLEEERDSAKEKVRSAS